MKKLSLLIAFLMISLACSYEIKTSNIESNIKPINTLTSSNSVTVNADNKTLVVENRQPQNSIKSANEKKPEGKLHEDLHDSNESENVDNLEGDDENSKEVVKFDKGKTSATFEYGLVRGERRTYIVEAKKGQTMSVRIEAEEKNAVFSITKSGKTVDTATETEKWSGTLPSDGKYEIEVSGTRGNASYIIEISVEN